ncbi:MAG: hypothetical protein KDB66_05325 [Solirubrobacterales bacterium]|nr:hypothetical protein [Solirubrobacterales bacterium]
MKRLALIAMTMLGMFGLAASASADEVWWKPIDAPLVVKPAEIVTSWGTSSSTLYFENLEWRGWESQRAEAKGKVQLNTCEPFCLAGNYVTVKAKVWLTKIRSVCGQPRYMHIRVAWRYQGKWWGENYPDVSCRGSMANPGGHPYPNLVPKPRPKPRLKGVTARSLYKRSVEDEFTFLKGQVRYIRCGRVARMRIRCRGKWSFAAAYDGGTSIGVWKTRGWVKRRNKDYTVKVKAKHWIIYPGYDFRNGPFRYTVWRFYEYR